MEETLPGVDDGPGERVICHVDMDCFYASCERLREPELDGEPVVVGMGYEHGETHGAVATASYEAREYGVDSAQPISEALERLPRMAEADRADPDAPNPGEAGHYRPVEMSFYESVASDVKEVLHDLADTVREVSIDEAYLDATAVTSWQRVGEESEKNEDSETEDSRTLAAGYGRHVKQAIQRRVGVPASVGVAPNMAVAKVASDHDKPDGLTVVPPSEVEQFLAPLPVEDIHGVGPVRARELAEMGIDTAGELADADPGRLVSQFGDRGRELYDRARGRDDRAVTPRGRPKSLSRESAFTEATDDGEAKREKVRALAADVAERARSREALYQTIGIKVVQPPFEVNTRAESLSGPVDDPELVRAVALDLLAEFEDDAVRKLGVRVSKLSFDGGRQASLGGYDDEGVGADDAGDGVSPATTLTDWAAPRRDDDTSGERPATLAEWAGDETDADRASDEVDTEPGGETGPTQPSLASFDDGEE
jgi:DNA polymerase IV (DinB-like DNA polymerase)